MPATAFTSILERLTEDEPAIWGVALVDPSGETVDYAGSLPPFSIQLAGSHMQLVAASAERLGQLSAAQFISVRASEQTLMVRFLFDSYVLVLVADPDIHFEKVDQSVARCVEAVCLEAGWPVEIGSEVDYFSNSSN